MNTLNVDQFLSDEQFKHYNGKIEKVECEDCGDKFDADYKKEIVGGLVVCEFCFTEFKYEPCERCGLPDRPDLMTEGCCSLCQGNYF